jgi:hypothetical protein
MTESQETLWKPEAVKAHFRDWTLTLQYYDSTSTSTQAMNNSYCTVTAASVTSYIHFLTQDYCTVYCTHIRRALPV